MEHAHTETYKIVSNSMETWARNTWKTDNVIFQCYFLQLKIFWFVFIGNHRENLPKQAHSWHEGYLLSLLWGLLFKITQWIILAGMQFQLAGSTKFSPLFKRKVKKHWARVTGAREMLGARELQGARVLQSTRELQSTHELQVKRVYRTLYSSIQKYKQTKHIKIMRKQKNKQTYKKKNTREKIKQNKTNRNE